MESNICQKSIRIELCQRLKTVLCNFIGRNRTFRLIYFSISYYIWEGHRAYMKNLPPHFPFIYVHAFYNKNHAVHLQTPFPLAQAARSICSWWKKVSDCYRIIHSIYLYQSNTWLLLSSKRKAHYLEPREFWYSARRKSSNSSFCVHYLTSCVAPPGRRERYSICQPKVLDDPNNSRYLGDVAKK